MSSGAQVALRLDRGAALLSALLCTAFGLLCVAAQISMLQHPELWETTPRAAFFQVVAPVCELLMIVSVIPIVFRLLCNPVMLRINARGLDVWLLGPIPWEEVGKAQIVQLRQGRFKRDGLRIDLHNLPRHKSRMDLWSRLLGGQTLLHEGALLYRSRTLAAPLPEIMAAIAAHRPKGCP